MAKSRALKKNMLAAVILAAMATTAASAATLSLVPSTTSPAVGGVVSFNVLVSGITDLYGFQYSLNFNPAVFKAVSGTEGSFLAAGGSTYFSPGTIDNTAGKISFVFDTLLGPTTGVSGSGVLETLSFNVAATGSSTFTFSDVLFLNSANADIAMTTTPLTLNVSAVPEPATYAMMGLGIAGLLAWRRRAA